jgi:glycosyltransferase involved in cell wall biosynthesis
MTARDSSDRTASAPLPSVVVPNLNNARFLVHTLDSIAAQSVPELDVVIVDGGSSDGSVDLIRTWAERHGARWLSEPDTGQAQAINKGFRMVRGDLVTWVNSDDLLHPSSAAHAVREFSLDPALEFLWGFCVEIDVDGAPLRVQNPIVRRELGELRRTRNFVPQPACWFRRSLLDRFGLLDETLHFAFDYELFLRFAGHARARFLPEILASFRVHPGSKTVSQTGAFFPEAWAAFRRHGGRLRSPFVLDSVRNRWLAPLWRSASSPLRSALRRAFGLRPGERVRP